VLEINSPVGNIFLDEGFNDLKNGNFEKLKISRVELEKKNFEKKD